ncbi:MAG: branched-chain amino acid ABC transporter permease [Armatimonadetes bacterium]|nr:branched-chain amino acid ABC transporter permease [Armatimonadota bacterium]
MKWMGLAASLAVPFVVADEYLLNVFILIWMNVALGSAWNIIGGYGGQHSLGHAAFFGIGAYLTLLFFQEWGSDPWLGMLSGAALSTLAAATVGWICFRLRGPYFTLSSIALAEVLRIITINWRSVTRGAEGILLAPDKIPMIFGQPLVGKLPFYYMMLGIAIISVALTAWIARSRLGYALVAVREDQDAAEALGVDATATKVLGLIVSAALVSATGSVFALYLRYVDPDTVLTLHRSVDMLLVAIMGGMGTVFGPVLGGIVLSGISETFRAFTGQANLLLYGIMVIVVILYLPGGLLGALRGKGRH